MAVSTLFAVLAVLVWKRRGVATRMDIVPAWNWGTVNFGRRSHRHVGLEAIGLMGGEIRDPSARCRGGWIASACITVFYGVSTVALLVILAPERISEMNGLAEAGDEASRVLGISWLAPVIALMVVASGMASSAAGTSTARLPFRRRADRLLPRVFSRVHPRWATPYAGILAMGGVATFLMIAIQLGDTMRAAYQELVSLM